MNNYVPNEGKSIDVPFPYTNPLEYHGPLPSTEPHHSKVKISNGKVEAVDRSVGQPWLNEATYSEPVVTEYTLPEMKNSTKRAKNAEIKRGDWLTQLKNDINDAFSKAGWAYKMKNPLDRTVRGINWLTQKAGLANHYVPPEPVSFRDFVDNYNLPDYDVNKNKNNPMLDYTDTIIYNKIEPNTKAGAVAKGMLAGLLNTQADPAQLAIEIGIGKALAAVPFLGKMAGESSKKLDGALFRKAYAKKPSYSGLGKSSALNDLASDISKLAGSADDAPFYMKVAKDKYLPPPQKLTVADLPDGITIDGDINSGAVRNRVNDIFNEQLRKKRIAEATDLDLHKLADETHIPYENLKAGRDARLSDMTLDDINRDIARQIANGNKSMEQSVLEALQDPKAYASKEAQINKLYQSMIKQSETKALPPPAPPRKLTWEDVPEVTPTAGADINSPAVQERLREIVGRRKLKQGLTKEASNLEDVMKTRNEAIADSIANGNNELRSMVINALRDPDAYMKKTYMSRIIRPRIVKHLGIPAWKEHPIKEATKALATSMSGALLPALKLYSDNEEARRLQDQAHEMNTRYNKELLPKLLAARQFNEALKEAGIDPAEYNAELASARKGE